MSRALFEDRYVRLTFDEGQGLVRYVRTREPFPSLDGMRATNERIRSAVALLGRKDLKLLLDLRDAPPRNDDDFEREVGRSLGAFLPGFRAHAMLVKTAVGRLQAQRMATGPGADRPPVFTTEADALAHLVA